MASHSIGPSGERCPPITVRVNDENVHRAQLPFPHGNWRRRIVKNGNDAGSRSKPAKNIGNRAYGQDVTDANCS